MDYMLELEAKCIVWHSLIPIEMEQGPVGVGVEQAS